MGVILILGSDAWRGCSNSKGINRNATCTWQIEGEY
jgi:hypothetical protein